MITKEKQKYLISKDIAIRKCISIDKSSNQLKSIINKCINPKFKNLDSWVSYQSKMFSKENVIVPTKYMTYKRGTIIYANFGTSIGVELSGYHFAIVLNKSDNPLNGSLTVVPLTSKNKKYNLSLGKELINKILSDSKNELLNISNMIKYMKQELHCEKIENDNKKLEFIIEYVEKHMTLKKNEDAYMIVEDEVNDMLYENILFLETVINHYRKNNKESYAMLDSVTTISKYRIQKPLNRMDPIGKITISESLLKLIDINLIKKFTNESLTT